ncbi:FG-GAP-like repeat-containing protein [Tamlana flava]|uniref:FG-GAP-like repeat-containing protein n=1 Tax=Tamlana flava TaxID=3158572 RepID=UPI00351AD46B
MAALFRLHGQTFQRIETIAGFKSLEENNGVAIADYDQDGDLDLFVVAKAKDQEGIEKSHSRLFSNNNDGTFSDVTNSSGLVDLFLESENSELYSGLTGYKYGAFFGDYDNDGFPDLFLTNNSKIQLFHNESNGQFREVTEEAGFQKHNTCLNSGAMWFDYNNDGLLDIYLTIWGSYCANNRLYKNNGDGTFSDVSDILKGATNKYSYQGLPFDFNRDGWLDLYVANDYNWQTNDLFINESGNSFIEQSNVYGLSHSRDDMGMAIGDYNNDGFFDFFITTINDNVLLTNKGNNTFEDFAPQYNLVETGWSWDVSFSDFDLDRDEDLFVVNGFKSTPVKNFYFKNLFANDGDGFIDSSEKSGLGEMTISVGAGIFDYDNDGDLDIVVTNNDRPSYFYENTTTDFVEPSDNLHWFKVKLQGTVSNRDAIGTTVSIKTASGSLYRYYTGKGFLSQNLRPVHFGLGADTEVLELKISWPSGIIEIYDNLPVDTTILVKEGNRYEILNIEPSIKIYGCTDPDSCNYNPYAITDSGYCGFMETGTISGKHNAVQNDTELYTYPLTEGYQINWQVSGGELVEGGDGSVIKVKWGTGDAGVISLIVFNGQCYSNEVELTVNLTDYGANDVVDESDLSVARLWNEALLDAIRRDYARPTVHARNLFHCSVAMYDAWAIFDDKAETYLIGKEVHGFKSEFEGFTPSLDENEFELRKKAISYAAYRILSHRFKQSPNASVTQEIFDLVMDKFGYHKTNESLDFSTGDGAALGNYIAQTVIDFGLTDGSNETNQYANKHYSPENPSLDLLNPGDISNIDPNKWQPLSFDSFVDQSGHVIDGRTPAFLGPEWGNVLPFAMDDSNKTVYERDGHSYSVYYDPGLPPNLNITENTEDCENYKWSFALVTRWAAHLDPNDGVLWDISPKTIGNISPEQWPHNFTNYKNFYNEVEGGDIGAGHDINPYTGQPYVAQMVPRGDYTRVLAEFWADGPDSETPPGHWFTVLNHVSDNKLFEKRFSGQGNILQELEWDVKAYFVLGGAVHDAAVAAWGIKGWYDYIRPISAIRYMANRGQSSDPSLPNYDIGGIPVKPGFIEVIKANDPLAGENMEHVGEIKLYTWKGHDFIDDPNIDQAGVGWILAKDWWPYQRPNFVTPPFAGFISGHSTFSRAGAEVMTLLTGDAYFPGGYGEFIAHKNEFLVFEEGPSVDVKLQWATYRDASDQCSLSRIWGGIHPPIDDIPGRIIGEAIGKKAFEFGVKYFEGLEEPVLVSVDELRVYPNPVAKVSGVINIIGTGEKDAISLYDLNGRALHVRSSEYNEDSRVTKLSLPNTMLTGMYVLKVNNRSVKVVVTSK